MRTVLSSLCLALLLIAPPSTLAMDPSASCDESCMEASRRREPEAMYRRGRHYLEGHPDGKPRLRWALRWFRKAAEADHADGQYALAWLLLNREEATWSHRHEAARWLRRADEQGHAQARLLLDSLQYHRLSTPVHYPGWPTATP